MQNHLLKNILFFVSYFLLILFTIYCHLILSKYTFDDSYISFRIARHFAEYGQPYFNIKESVMASAVPAWNLLMYIPFKMFSDPLLVLSIMNSIALVGASFTCCLLVTQHLKISFTTLIYHAFIYICFAGALLSSTTGLTEVGWAILFLSVGQLCLLRDKPIGFFFLTISIFIRPEMSLFWFGSLLWYIKRRNYLVTAALWSFFGGAPFLVYELYFFGTLIPNCIVAKMKVFSLNVFDTCQQIFEYIFPDAGYSFSQRLVLVVFIIFFFLINCFFMLKRIRKNKHVLYFWILPAAVILIGYIMSHTIIHGWYIPLFTVPLILAQAFFLYHSKSNFIRFLSIVFLSPFIIWFYLMFMATVKSPDYHPLFKMQARVLRYQELGNLLWSFFPESTLMAVEIGGIGYSFKGYIYDALGIASPAALSYHPLPIPDRRAEGMSGIIPSEYIDKIYPDIIVSMDKFMTDKKKSNKIDEYSLYSCSIFRKEESGYLKTDEELWGSRNINIYLKKTITKTELFAQNISEIGCFLVR